MRLFFNIILVICIVILVTHQSFYLYKYNKILGRITFLLADEKIKKEVADFARNFPLPSDL